MKQYAFCPYVQNISIIKNFFARPLTLIIGIFFAVTATFNFVAAFLTSSNSFQIRLDAISIMLSIAFFLLYFLGKSKKPNISFSAPLNLIKTVSIINIVLAGIALSAFAFLILITLAIPALQINSILSVLFIPVVITAPVLLVQLIYYIFFLVFAGSMKKSVSSIYLRKKGAAAFGVTSIILIVFNLAMTAVSVKLLPVFMKQYIEALQTAAGFTGSTEFQSYIADYLANSNIFASYTDIISIISFGITIVCYILLAVFALSYKSYINKYTDNINVFENKQENQDCFVPRSMETPVPPEMPIENSTPFLADAVFNDTPAMAPPIPPQHDANNSQAAFDPNTISFFDENQNPYTQPPLLEQIQICPRCGNWCNFDDFHCGTCGHKLK